MLQDEVEGIPVTDEKLAERYGDTQAEGLILHGIQASENVKAFLALPPKFKVFMELDKESAEVDREVTAAKQRYSRIEDK